MVESTEKWRAQVVYGDTDSIFVHLPGRSREQAFQVAAVQPRRSASPLTAARTGARLRRRAQIGREIADAVTAANPPPVLLKFEKVYDGR